MYNQSVVEQFVNYMNGKGSSLDERPIYQISPKDITVDDEEFVTFEDEGNVVTYTYRAVRIKTPKGEIVEYDFDHFSTKLIHAQLNKAERFDGQWI